MTASRPRPFASQLCCAARLVVALVLLTLSPAALEAACLNGQAEQAIVGDGTALQAALDNSTPPCTINLAAGTYVSPGSNSFIVKNGIRVVGSGSGNTVLQASNFAVVVVSAIQGSCPNNATVQGVRLRGGPWGLYAGVLDPANNYGCSLGRINGLTIRDVVVENASNGHGIVFNNVHSSTIDSATVVSAHALGIAITAGSSYNVLMNSTVQHTETQHAIALLDASNNTVVGNTVTGSAFDGILLASATAVIGEGSSHNRVERNVISGHRIDGITLTDNSRFNYVGLNVISSPVPNTGAGAGIWINNASNGNYIFGNDVSGAPENGIDVLTSRSTYIEGNSAHGNAQGGIWVANIHDVTIAPGAPPPQDTVIHGNHLYFNALSANVFLQGAANSEVAYNYMGGTTSPLSLTLPSIYTGGLRLLDAGNVAFFENTVNAVSSRAFVQGATSNISVFRNRFLRGTNVPNPPQADGLNGVTYSLLPSDVRWDGGSFLGGNFWNEATATLPYTGFIGNTNGAPYVDRYPYPSEDLLSPSLTSGVNVARSVSVLEPASSAVLGPATRKTIRWVARGCALVDIHYTYPGGSLVPIATSAPNTGLSYWTVPAAAVRSDYVVRVSCANSSGGAIGVTGTSSPFTIAQSGLTLLSPGRQTRATSGGVLRVAWKATVSTGNVLIYMRVGSGTEMLVDTAPAGTTFKDVILPHAVSDSSRVSLRIVDAGNASRSDSVDGFILVRGGAPSFATNLGGQTLLVGSLQHLEWNGHADSYLVDLDLILNGVVVTPIAHNLPDFGHYTAFVADVPAASAAVRVTFKNYAGAAFTSVDSATFSITRAAGAPPPTPPSANFSTRERDLDGDGRSDLIVYRPGSGSWFIRYSSQGYNAATAAMVQWGLPGDVPISADFDGDGKIELTVFRPATAEWFIRFSSQGHSVASYALYQWGLPGDVPLASDFDGDGKADLTVFRPATGQWFTRYSSQSYSVATYGVYQWGLSGDVPLIADFDADGRTDLVVFRPATAEWFIRFSSLGYSASAFATYQWGLPGDVPLATDFDGDGRTDLTVFRPAYGGWFIRYSSQSYSVAGYTYFQWGLPGDTPLTLDLDADNKSELVVYRPGSSEWFVRYSTLGYNPASYSQFQWGLFGDALLK